MGSNEAHRDITALRYFPWALTWVFLLNTDVNPNAVAAANGHMWRRGLRPCYSHGLEEVVGAKLTLEGTG